MYRDLSIILKEIEKYKDVHLWAFTDDAAGTLTGLVRYLEPLITEVKYLRTELGLIEDDVIC
jgi:hypothetical protein